MNSYIKSTVPFIEAKYSAFTQIEKGIADFFIANTEDIDFSSKAISAKLFVSEASLSRFAQKCGFKGYREFIYQYKQGLNNVKTVDSTSGMLVLNTYQELLNKTYSLLDKSQLDRIVGYLIEAKRIFACGKGSSGFVASEMESRFMRTGLDIDSILDSDRMRMQSVFTDKSSLVFGFSLGGETAPVLYLLKEAYNRGAKTILFTSVDNGEFVNYCTELVLVPSLKHLNYGSVISLQIPLLILLDIIYNEYVTKDESLKTALYIDTLKALKSEPPA